MGTALTVALLMFGVPMPLRAEAATTTEPVVLFVQGSPGQEPEGTHLVPVVCYKPGIGLVSAATADCLSLVPKDAPVALASGATVGVLGREPAACIDYEGESTGESRDSVLVPQQMGRIAYAIWPPSALSRIKPLCQSPPECLAHPVPIDELDSVDKLVRRRARGDGEILQRIDSDLDGDGRPDLAYSVDVRCTKKEMRARTGTPDGEPWSCFNGLVVRWGGSKALEVVAKDWDLGRIAAVFDFDGDRRPEILVFAPQNQGMRIQVFSVDKRRLRPLEPWCCGCNKKALNEPSGERARRAAAR